MMTGTIKRIVHDKGYGFVRTPQGLEYFFHRSAVPQGGFDALQEGQPVHFEEEQSPKGPRATNVTLDES